MTAPQKRSLTIEAIVGPDKALLGQITTALRVLPLPPESFMWSVLSHSHEARVWLTLSDSDDNLRDLIAALKQIAGIHRIVLHGSSGATLSLYTSNHAPITANAESDSSSLVHPFVD